MLDEGEARGAARNEVHPVRRRGDYWCADDLDVVAEIRVGAGAGASHVGVLWRAHSRRGEVLLPEERTGIAIVGVDGVVDRRDEDNVVRAACYRDASNHQRLGVDLVIDR